jgi:hypothetical protein
VAAFPLGALVAGLSAGALVRRFRSSRVALVGTLLTGAAVLLAGAGSAWITLALGMALAGAMDSITDVAQNSHGLRVQRLFKRSILNSFHAIWSVGAVTGGVLGAAAAQAEVPIVLHLALSAVVFGGLAVGAYRRGRRCSRWGRHCSRWGRHCSRWRHSPRCRDEDRRALEPRRTPQVRHHRRPRDHRFGGCDR